MAPEALRIVIRHQIRVDLAAGSAHGMTEAVTGQVGQMQRTAAQSRAITRTRGAALCDMAECIGAGIPIEGGIRRRTDTDGIEHDQKDSRCPPSFPPSLSHGSWSRHSLTTPASAVARSKAAANSARV